MKKETAQKILKKNKIDWEKIAPEFQKKRNYLWPELLDFKKYVKEGDRILDLGCGNGRLLELVKDIRMEYVGVDSSEKLIEEARKRIKNQELRIKNINQNVKIEFLWADALELSFEEDSFDVVFLVAMLHHIPSQGLQLEVLKNIYRVLKEGGYLLMTNWNLWQPKYWKYRFNSKSSLSTRDLFIPWHLKNGEIVQRYYHVFTGRELRKLLKRVHLKIIGVYYSQKDRKAHPWNGGNLVMIGQK